MMDSIDHPPVASPSHLAILIDAEDVSATCWPAVLRHAPLFGTVHLARTYACQGRAAAWSGIDGVESDAGSGGPDGPNAADFRLAMDAAVMVATGEVDTVIMVTGDDGFAAIAHDLKRRGARVYAFIPADRPGMPRRLASAVDVAVLVPGAREISPEKKKKTSAHTAAGTTAADTEAAILAILRQHALTQPDGWLSIDLLGTELKAAGCARPKPGLAKFVRTLSSVETNGKKGTKFAVRLGAAGAVEGDPLPDDDAADIPF